MLNSFYRSID